MADTAGARQPGRPRRPGVSAKVLAATAALATTKGYRHMTIDEIARVSDVAKTTIYRRWRSKGEIAVDSLASVLGEVPQSQSSADDALHAAIDWLARRIGERPVRALLLGLVVEASEDATIRARLRGRLREPFTNRLAADWGLPPAELDVAFDIVVGGLLHRLAMNGEITDTDTEAFGAAATALLSPGMSPRR